MAPPGSCTRRGAVGPKTANCCRGSANTTGRSQCTATASALRRRRPGRRASSAGPKWVQLLGVPGIAAARAADHHTGGAVGIELAAPLPQARVIETECARVPQPDPMPHACAKLVLDLLAAPAQRRHASLAVMALACKNAGSLDRSP